MFNFGLVCSFPTGCDYVAGFILIIKIQIYLCITIYPSPGEGWGHSTLLAQCYMAAYIALCP